MKTFRIILLTAVALVVTSDIRAQKPAWVDDPGVYSAENFVAVGIAKNKKIDKAREKAEKKARKGVLDLIKKKYPKKDVESATSHIRIESFWLDEATGYQYALALLPMEEIDKGYSARKKSERAKNSAMGAVQMLNATLKDPDVVIVQVDEFEDESMESISENESETTTSGSAASTVSGQTTDFKNKSLGTFSWIDQDGNSKYSFLGGNLSVSVAGYESFKPEDGDKKAPRIEGANVTGDFVIEAKFKMDWEKYYHAGAGLYALNGKQNVLTFAKYNGSYVYHVGYANDIELPRTEKSIAALTGYVFFKLERKGYTFTSYYSTVEGDWIEIGSSETEFPSSCQVGVVFLNDEQSTVPVKCDYVVLHQ